MDNNCDKMSLLRQPLSLVRQCSSLLARGGFASVRHCSAESSSEPAVEVASESLIREAVAAVKESQAASTLPPIDSYPEKYGLDGLEYTGRANIDYTDPFIHYKLEVDMESLRLDQPHPKAWN